MRPQFSLLLQSVGALLHSLLERKVKGSFLGKLTSPIKNAYCEKITLLQCHTAGKPTTCNSLPCSWNFQSALDVLLLNDQILLEGILIWKRLKQKQTNRNNWSKWRLCRPEENILNNLKFILSKRIYFIQVIRTDHYRKEHSEYQNELLEINIWMQKLNLIEELENTFEKNLWQIT